MKLRKLSHRVCLPLVALLLLVGCVPMEAMPEGHAAPADTHKGEFTRLDTGTADPSGHNVAEHCGGDFPEAGAQITINQAGGNSTVKITLENARPETLYTTWLRLRGKTMGDEPTEYGGSPLTGAGSTPLAASSEVESLLAAADGPGVTEVANGFRTDTEGNGELVAELDFPVLGGAYPFYRHDESLAPLAIIGAPFAPFMIRIASHCTDDMGHGVNAGNREPWFDWSPQHETAMDAEMSSDENIVIGIVPAPNAPGGIVADEPTAINILMNAPGADDHYVSNPAHFGHQIPAGGWMEIEFGGTFVRKGVDNDAEFAPVDSNLNLIILAGNPQSAIVAVAGPGAQHGNYTIEDNGDKIITVRPNGGSGDMGVEGERAEKIGLKTLHLLPVRTSDSGPAPFQNGPAGTVGTASVRIFDADGELLESGDASVEFPESYGRHISPINFGFGAGPPFGPDVVSEFVEWTNWQHVAPGTQLVNTMQPEGGSFAAGLPYALRFLLTEAIEEQPDSFAPMIGIPDVGIVVDDENPAEALMVQDVDGNGTLDESDTTVGTITITGPSAESSGQILAPADWPLTASGDGIEGAPGSFFNVPVEVGREAGIYEVTVSLEGGDSATLFVVVDEGAGAESMSIGGKIANAMSAGPPAVADEATILDFPEGYPGSWPDEPVEGELVELRAGSNGWTCIVDRPETPGNDPMCLNETYLEVLKAQHALTDGPSSGIGIGYMLQEGGPAGSPPHMMFFAPGSNDDLTAFTTEPGPTPWVMFPDTTYAHLMLTQVPRPESVSADEDKIANAMSAGPAAIAQDATILDFPEGYPGNWPDEPLEGELVELRAGSNGWTCIVDIPNTPGKRSHVPERDLSRITDGTLRLNRRAIQRHWHWLHAPGRRACRHPSAHDGLCPRQQRRSSSLHDRAGSVTMGHVPGHHLCTRDADLLLRRELS